METAISAAEANRQFSRLLREVRNGASFTVTSRGEPVARLVPVGEDRQQLECGWKELLDRLEKQEPMNLGPWTREELYER